MPDFEAPVVAGTAADKAVAYILTRVERDPNFRHYMLGTEGLRLCLVAQAEREGKDEVSIATITAMEDAPPATGDGLRTPDIARMRRRIEAVESYISDLRSRGRLSNEIYGVLSNLIQGRQA